MSKENLYDTGDQPYEGLEKKVYDSNEDAGKSPEQVIEEIEQEENEVSEEAEDLRETLTDEEVDEKIDSLADDEEVDAFVDDEEFQQEEKELEGEADLSDDVEINKMTKDKKGGLKEIEKSVDKKKEVVKSTGFGPLYDTSGKEVPLEDYVILENLGVEEIKTGGKFTPATTLYGQPFTQDQDEELVQIFREVFDTKTPFLLYKKKRINLFNVIIPRKFARDVTVRDSFTDGEAQVHAVSFVEEGSVTPEAFRLKMVRVRNYIATRMKQYI